MIKKVLTFSDNIQHVLSGAHGLWIGHQGGVSYLDTATGVACKWTTLEGLPAHPVLHVALDGERLCVATPNGVAWVDDVEALIADGSAARGKVRWRHGLSLPTGAGAFINGVAFVQGRIWAAAGGGRAYREGADGFELLELPLPQARLVRILALDSPPGTRRILMLTNNNGILMVATGGTESGLYQWSENEGLDSRYATALALAGSHVAVAVHGALHFVTQRALVEAPEHISRWGTVQLAEVSGSAERNRVSALCVHGRFLYAGTATGLHRVRLEDLGDAMAEPSTAEMVDDFPVRHLASHAGELWVGQGSTLARWSDAVAAPSTPPEHASAARGRWPRVRGASRLEEFAPRVVASRRPRFVVESRWRTAAEPDFKVCRALAASPESLLVGGESGRVVLFSEGRWSNELVVRMRRPSDVHALAWDPEGMIFWAATRQGLFQRDPRGRWHRDLQFPGRAVHALGVWGGSVIAVGAAGLHLFVQNEWNEVDLGREHIALFAAAASDSALALGGRPGTGFWIWRSGAARPEPVVIPMGRANCMAWGDGGDLWLGGDRGVVRWQGETATTFAWNDERRDQITALLEHDGKLYVGSQAGLWVVAVRNLRRGAAAELESQGERVGLLQGLPDTNVTGLLAHDSRVWVATQGGLARLE